MSTAATCDANEILNIVRCYETCVSADVRAAVVICLLDQLLHAINPEADVSIDTLVQEATCFSRRIPPGMNEAVTNYLLCQILYNIVLSGGGFCGNCGNMTGPNSPEGVVTASPGRLYFQDNGSNYVIWIKRTGTNTNTGWFSGVQMA